MSAVCLQQRTTEGLAQSACGTQSCSVRRSWSSPASVNQEEVELGLMVPNRTTWLSSVPLLTATQIRGQVCSGTTNISKTSNGHGSGKSMFCWNREILNYIFQWSLDSIRIWIFIFFVEVMLWRAATDLNEHKLLHGLHPLQQHDAGLKSPTQVFMPRVWVTHCMDHNRY